MSRAKPIKPSMSLRSIRYAMSLATEKFTPGGQVNPKRKPVTLRRADYERRKGLDSAGSEA